jgi:hypothetical protein
MFIICWVGGKNMVKVALELSKLEIEMFHHCIQMAIDTKYVDGKNKETAEKLANQLSKYL